MFYSKRPDILVRYTYKSFNVRGFATRVWFVQPKVFLGLLAFRAEWKPLFSIGSVRVIKLITCYLA